MKHRVVFFGSSAFGLPSLQAILLMADVELVAVVSQPSKPVGRKGLITPTPVGLWAEQHGIPLLTPISLRSGEAVQKLQKLEADTFVVAAYGLILPPEVLQIPKNGCINLHASLLPNYRGASPIAAAIVDDQKETGISFMVMDAGIDTGPVLQRYSLPIRADDSAPELEDRLAQLAASHVQEILLAWWSNELKPKSQTGKSSYVSMLTSEDGRARWESAVVLERKIRAYRPWPGIWTLWKGQRFKLLSGRVIIKPQTEPSGKIVAIPEKPGWAIACQDGLLILEQVQLAGKKPIPADDIPVNYQHFIGSYLG